MRCVACWCALFWVTRATTPMCRCGGWCFSYCVRLHACVRGVMVAGSAALVGMCVRCASGLRNCEESWLRHTRDVECASLACITGAVSSAVSRVLCRSIAIAACVVACSLLHRVSLWLLCDCVTLRGIVCILSLACDCVSRGAARKGALPPRWRGSCVVRVLSVAVAAVAGSPLSTRAW
jgi:hypothetical protein